MRLHPQLYPSSAMSSNRGVKPIYTTCEGAMETKRKRLYWESKSHPKRGSSMTTITVTYDSGETSSYPSGIRALDVLASSGKTDQPLVAAIVDNELMSLDTELESDCRIRAVLADSAAGAAVYRRSLCFLLAIASR